MHLCDDALSHMTEDIITAFVLAAALPELIRAQLSKPKVGDYSCLFFLSVGRIFILFTFYPPPPHCKSDYSAEAEFERESYCARSFEGKYNVTFS